MFTKKITVAAVGISLLLTACSSVNTENSNQTSKPVSETQNSIKLTDVPFTLAKNYFVRNTVEKIENPKIETAEKFNEIFGMARTMNNEGKPTEIDFKKQYVIAVILPETDLMKTLEPVSLQKDDKGKITLNYKVVVGEKRSFTIRPNFALIVNNTENGVIELKEQ